MKDMKKRKVEGIIFIFTSFCFIMVGILVLIEKIQVCSMNINLKNGVSFYSDSSSEYDGEYDIAQLLPMINSDNELYINEDDILVCYNSGSVGENDGRYIALSDSSKSQGETRYIAQIDSEKHNEEPKVRSSKFANNCIYEEDINYIDNISQQEEEDKVDETSEPTQNNENISTNNINNNQVNSNQVNKSTVAYSNKKKYTNKNRYIANWKQDKGYKVGDKVTFNGRTYSCVQSHDSLSTWEPNLTPALWNQIS